MQCRKLKKSKNSTKQLLTSPSSTDCGCCSRMLCFPCTVKSQMWQIWIDKSIPVLSLWDKNVTRTWWWRGEKGRLWTHFTRSSSRPAAAAPRFVSLLLWETWRLILPRWTCLCKGDCRRPPCCSGSTPSLAWVSVHVHTVHVHWKHWKRCIWWSISGMVLFIKDKSAVIRCFFTEVLQTCWIWKVCWIWQQEKCCHIWHELLVSQKREPSSTWPERSPQLHTVCSLNLRLHYTY